jgi:WD40 repeat protein
MRLAPLRVVGGLLLAVGLALGGVGALVPLARAERRPEAARNEPPDAPPPVAPKRPGLDYYGDQLPEKALARLGSLRLHHGFMSNALAYSPDGKVLASASEGRGLCLWDVATGRLLHELGPRRSLCSASFSPDGRLIAAGDGIASIRVWDVPSGKVVKHLGGNAKGITMVVAFSPDGKRIASGGHDKLVRIWDLATGTELRQLAGHRGVIRSLAFSSDGHLLAAAGSDQVVRLWDPTTGAARGVLAGHQENFLWMAMSPDGRRLVSGAQDYTNGPHDLRLWDTATGKTVKHLGADNEDISAVAFSPDGVTIASGHRDGVVRLWDAISGRELRHLQAGSLRSTALAFSPDGKTLATGGSLDSTVRQWDVETGKEQRPLRGPRGFTDWLTFGPGGRFVYVGSHDHTVRRWDWARDAEQTQVTWGRSSAFHGFALGADGPAVAFYDYVAHDVYVAGSGRPSRVLTRVLADHPQSVLAFGFSPDGRRLLWGGQDKAVHLWDVAGQKELWKVPSDDQVNLLAYSPDGRTFVLGNDNTIGGRGPLRGPPLRLCDAATGKELRAFDCREPAYRVAFSPDGTRIATLGGLDGAPPQLWETATGKEYPLPVDMRRCSCVAFSPDGRLLAVGNEEPGDTLAVVEVAAGQVVRSFRGHTSGVMAAAFSPDGKYLASGGGDANILVWDLTGHATARGTVAAVDAAKAWDELASPDASRAYTAVWNLAAIPDQAAALLRQRLRPAAALDEAGRRRVKQWVADLDGDSFEVRQRAAGGLEMLGEAAAPALREALQAGPGTEARRQIERLLEGMSGWSAERLRVSRAVAVLEQVATPEARHLLQDLAGGAPEALPTREAKAALGRLARRTGKH